MRRSFLLVALAVAGCGSSVAGRDAGGSSDDAGTVDAGASDAGAVDAGPADSGSVDAGPVDAGPDDAGPLDAGYVDAGPEDAGPVDAGPIDAGPFDAGYVDAGPFIVVRIMTGNLSSGNLQSYDPGEGIRIFAGLHPDIALVQEFNYGSNSDTDIRSMVDQAFGPDFAVVRGQAGTQQIPNGVVSRYPIVASGEWTDPQVGNRDFVWARIALPGGHELTAISVHLLTSSGANRQAEAQALVGDINQDVPTGDFVVLGGDFNTGTRTEACVNTLSAVFATSGPYPADQLSNENTSANRSKPYDWVLVDPALDADEVPLEVGSQTFSDGLVFDSRVFTPLSDVAPVQSGDSAATNMQHMGVIREFRIAN